MQISWLGYSAFKITSNGGTIITDPIDSASNFKIHKQGADLVVASKAGADNESVMSGTPFIITDPGEYEVKSVFVHGVEDGGALVYMITIEDMQIAYLGAFPSRDLSEVHVALLEGADILIVPVGGGNVAKASDAAKIISQVEPRIVIPSYFSVSGSKGLDNISVFLKEYSAVHETVEKLKVGKKDLPQEEETKIIVLQQS